MLSNVFEGQNYINSAMVRPSPQFFKYIKYIKTGNVKVDPAPDVSNRAEGGVIHPNSISLIFEELGVTVIHLNTVDASVNFSVINIQLTYDSVKSRLLYSILIKTTSTMMMTASCFWLSVAMGLRKVV